MTSIGKVVMTPKGAYSASATYNHLDWVRYNGSAWVCKQDNVVGVTPVEGDTWTLLVSGSGASITVSNKTMIFSV